MNIFSVISAILALLYLELGLYVLLKNKKSLVSIFFFLLSLCFSFWSFIYVFVYDADNAQTAVLLDSIASIGYCLFPAFMVLFHRQIYSRRKLLNWHVPVIVMLFMVGVTLSAATLSGIWRPQEIVRFDQSWHFIHNPRDLFYILFYLYLLVSSIFTFFFLLRWRSTIKDKYEIVQFRLIFYPLLSFLLLGVFFDIINPLISSLEFPNIGHITSFPWLVGVSVGVLRFRFISNLNYTIADSVAEQINEIVVFIDTSRKILKTNRFTDKLLGSENKDMKGSSIYRFFERKTFLDHVLDGALRKDDNHYGPFETELISLNNTPIPCKLYVISEKDRFQDIKGFIIYGHDNREAISLKNEIKIRQHAERNLRSISEVLENRVKERTHELSESYKELQVKMTERMRVEEQIKSDIAEKEILINEILNRVKSNMNIIISLINTQERKNRKTAITKKFNELSQRVKALLLVHENLYLSINYSDVDFANYLRDLAAQLNEKYNAKNNIEIKLDLSDVFLDVDYAIPLATVVNELISNSLQHAFTAYSLKKYPDKKRVVYVSYSFDNNNYEITISDNGKGLPKGFSIDELPTNGLPLSDILVNDQINGKMEYTTDKQGTTFKITFKAHD